MNQNKHLPIAIMTLSGLLLLVVSFSMLGYSYLALNQTPTNESQQNQTVKINPFADINLEAKAAIVLDVKTGEIIYAKNINEPLPLASITKLMTALVADNSIPLPKNTTVTINSEAIKAEGDNGFKPGEVWRLTDLIDFSLIVSSNDGAKALASAAALSNNKDFIAEMNNQAQKLNLTEMSFQNETGLDLPDQAGASAFGSAENVARLLAYIYNTKPELVEATKQPKTIITNLAGQNYTAKNTNDIAAKIPGLLASKTGFTDLSGGNLAILFDRGLNQPAAIVVLGSSQEGRFTDVLQLSHATIIALENQLTDK